MERTKVEHCALSGSDLKIKFRTILLTSISYLSMNKVRWCYFDEGNLQAIYRCERRPESYNRSIETDIYL